MEVYKTSEPAFCGLFNIPADVALFQRCIFFDFKGILIFKLNIKRIILSFLYLEFFKQLLQ